MSTAARLFYEAFSVAREQRSQEYRDGVLDALRFKLGETGRVIGNQRKYEIGSAKLDAYLAGCDEGRRRANEYLAKEPKG